MAVKRPNFHKRRNTVSSALVTKRVTKKSTGKRNSVPVEKKKNSSLFRALIVVLFLSFLGMDSNMSPLPNFSRTLAGESPDLSQTKEELNDLALSLNVENTSNEEGNGAQTQILGEVGLNSEQMRKVAKNILMVANAITDEYEVADGLNLAMYVLRYFAEIGEYELAQKDILILVRAFEKLSGQEVGEEVDSILTQISKIRFGKREGKYFSQIFSLRPSSGIRIPINELSEDPKSSVKEIREVVLLEGATLTFDEVDSANDKKKVREFIKTPIRVLGVIEALASSLNQIHSGIIDNIDDYLEREDIITPAMIIGMEGIYVDVVTDTILKDIQFNFNQAISLPKLTEDGNPLPSFVLGAKAKLLNLKVSVDQ